MNFLRTCAWLLPSAFLAAVFSFLLTHGPGDSALAVYPFFRDWIGADRLPRSAEVGFLLESSVLFLLPFAFWLAFLVLVSVAERAVFGEAKRRPQGPFPRVFFRIYAAALVIGAAILGSSTGILRKKLGGDTQIGAVAVAAAPFAAALLAAPPAFLIAVPLAGLLRMRE